MPIHKPEIKSIKNLRECTIQRLLLRWKPFPRLCPVLLFHIGLPENMPPGVLLGDLLSVGEVPLRSQRRPIPMRIVAMHFVLSGSRKFCSDFG